MTDQGVKPQNQKQLLIWNKYTDKVGYTPTDWEFYPIWVWPRDLSTAVMSESLNYKTRFRLFVYFIGNGMDPRNARDIIKRMLKDQDDKDHIDSLYLDLMKNKHKWTYWDEKEKKFLTLDDTLPITSLSKHSLKYGKIRSSRNSKKEFDWEKYYKWMDSLPDAADLVEEEAPSLTTIEEVEKWFA